MKVYTFIFTVGFLNLTIPFLGIPFVYKNYVLLTLSVITIGYALILRTVEHEKRFFREQKKQSEVKIEKTIEEVVEMKTVLEQNTVPDQVIKRRGRQPKVSVQEHIYE
jgi:hypothetical protein